MVVTTIRYNDVIHDFGLLNGLAEIPQTKTLFLQAAAERHIYKKQSALKNKALLFIFKVLNFLARKKSLES